MKTSADADALASAVEEPRFSILRPVADRVHKHPGALETILVVVATTIEVGEHTTLEGELNPIAGVDPAWSGAYPSWYGTAVTESRCDEHLECRSITAGFLVKAVDDRRAGVIREGRGVGFPVPVDERPRQPVEDLGCRRPADTRVVQLAVHRILRRIHLTPQDRIDIIPRG